MPGPVLRVVRRKAAASPAQTLRASQPDPSAARKPARVPDARCPGSWRGQPAPIRRRRRPKLRRAYTRSRPVPHRARLHRPLHSACPWRSPARPARAASHNGHRRAADRGPPRSASRRTPARPSLFRFPGKSSQPGQAFRLRFSRLAPSCTRRGPALYRPDRHLPAHKMSPPAPWRRAHPPVRPLQTTAAPAPDPPALPRFRICT